MNSNEERILKPFSDGESAIGVGGRGKALWRDAEWGL